MTSRFVGSIVDGVPDHAHSSKLNDRKERQEKDYRCKRKLDARNPSTVVRGSGHHDLKPP